MSLYSLNKDELVKIICHISADKDKQIAELNKKHNYLVHCAIESDMYFGDCAICKDVMISEFDDFNIYCAQCFRYFHKDCLTHCYNCQTCSNCNPGKYFQGKYICRACQRL
jgi:hypothetical protein